MRVFGEAPWNEGYICTVTGKLFPLWANLSNCLCCKIPNPLKPFYTKEELRETFIKLEKQDGYRENIAKNSDNIPVGFMWGWNSDMNAINKGKLGLSDENLKELQLRIQETNTHFNLQKFYYFAEIGIDAQTRGYDIAGMLYREQVKSVIENQNGSILVRTTKSTDLPYKWFIKMWYIPVFEYNDEQDRVILIKQYS